MSVTTSKEGADQPSGKFRDSAIAEFAAASQEDATAAAVADGIYRGVPSASGASSENVVPSSARRFFKLPRSGIVKGKLHYP